MLEDLRNTVDFFIRNKTRFSRKGFVEKNPKLIERNKSENLYTKDVLAKYFTQTPRDYAKILDIGCKNWFYAKGEHNFFNQFCKKFVLEGVELDPHRLYSNFYSRYEVAKYYINGLENVNYISGNLLDLKNKYDYIIWFLPFVVLEPHLYWGLPKKLFCPERLLEHAFSLLNQNGEMLIINQGKTEAEVQRKMLEKLQIKYNDLGIIKNNYFEYQNERFGFLIKN